MSLAEIKDGIEGRTCVGCGTWKPVAEFFQDRRRKYAGQTGGMRARCRGCTSEDNRRRRSANPEQHREWERLSTASRTPERIAEISSRNLPYRLRRWGLTEEQFWAMMEAQGHKCAICSLPVSVSPQGKGNRSSACIDHDHITGAIRGILCQGCNTGIGFLKDSAEIVLLAARYLGAKE